VLEGSVRKAGDRLRITAQLIRTIDGYHLWSQAYDRKLDDVFAIQEEIARAIADALSIQLKISADGKEAAPTQDMAAYASYLEARALISQRYMLRASALLEGAVQRDPTFAKAWAALAQTRALGMTYGLASREESRTGAETAARKALAIDDSIGLAHSALAGVLSSREQWLESEREYRRALELSPGEAETHNQYAQMLLSVGRLDAALEHAKRACELDPLAWVPPCIATLIEVSRNDLEQASGWLERSKKLGGPTNVLVLRLELVYALARRDTARARQVVVAARSEESSSPGAKEVIDILDQLISESAVAKPARDYKPALEAATAPGAVDLANDIATIFSFANRPQIALDILIAEMQSTYGNPQWIWTPPLSPIRKDPRFLELLTTLKLPDYWRVAGWPTFCRAKGDTDFECSDR
jgi:Tfp pilus assembly protein PilF